MMQHVVASWWQWMAPMVWQVAVLVTILLAVDVVLRRWAWPQVRHALWLLVLVKLVLPPGCSAPMAVVPRVAERLPAAASAGEISSESRSEAGAAGRQAGVEAGSASHSSGAMAAAGQKGFMETPPALDWRVVLFVVWIAGMGVFTAILVARMARLARWHRQHETKPTIAPWFYDLLVQVAQKLDLDRVPAIVFSKEAATPAVYGVWRPVLLLPQRYAEALPKEEAEHVLFHELAHLKRGDLLVHSVTLALQIIYWFNPFVAVARRRIKYVRELCCDLTVASHLKERTMAYRQTLLSTARELLSEKVQPSLGLLGVFEEPHKLVVRVRWLEKPTWLRHRRMIVASWLVAILAAPVLLPMAAGVSTPPESGLTGGQSMDANNAPPLEAPKAAPAGVCYHVSNVFRADTHVLGLRVSSEKLATSETWVAVDVIAGTERGRTTIVDRANKLLTLIDHEAETWVQTPLPLAVMDIFSDRALKQYNGIRSSGEVVVNGRSKRILERRCAEFEVSSWRTRGGGEIINPSSMKVWATEDVPFDISLFDALLLNLRLIYNRDAAYRQELKKIRGLQMGLEMREGTALFNKRLIDEVVEISKIEPPAGIFEPPPGYRRLKKLESIGL